MLFRSVPAVHLEVVGEVRPLANGARTARPQHDPPEYEGQRNEAVDRTACGRGRPRSGTDNFGMHRRRCISKLLVI